MESFSGFDMEKEMAALEGRLGMKLSGVLTNLMLFYVLLIA